MSPDRCMFARKTTFLSRYAAEEWIRWLEQYGHESARGMHAYVCTHFLSRSVSEQIVDRLSEQLRVITEQAQSPVAFGAQQATDRAGGVVVIDGECGAVRVPAGGLMRSANAAPKLLVGQQGIVVRFGQTVLSAQLPCTVSGALPLWIGAVIDTRLLPLTNPALASEQMPLGGSPAEVVGGLVLFTSNADPTLWGRFDLCQPYFLSLLQGHRLAFFRHDSIIPLTNPSRVRGAHWHIGHPARPRAQEGVERETVRMAEYGGSDPT